jgi:tripartite-type tricarboxylate transporter receptor subunit TctC
VRRRALLAAAFAWSAAPAIAQSWPDHPVRIVVAVSAGGSIDTLTRIIADKLTERWKQGVVVDNRPGGAGNVGAALAARAAPDGYTLHMAGQSLTSNVTNAPETAPDPIKDFEPIVFVAFAQDVLVVNKDSPFKSVADLVAAAKARPRQLNYASLGTSSSAHLATVQFEDLTGVRAEHVPYSNFGQMQTDLLSGRLSFWLTTIGGVFPTIKSGGARALAVSGAERAAQLPDVPTFKELGVDLVEPSSWYAFAAPKGTPRDIVAKINADVNAVLNEPDMRAKLAALGYLLKNGTPGELADFFKRDTGRWRELAKSPAYNDN